MGLILAYRKYMLMKTQLKYLMGGEHRNEYRIKEQLDVKDYLMKHPLLFFTKEFVNDTPYNKMINSFTAVALNKKRYKSELEDMKIIIKKDKRKKI